MIDGAFLNRTLGTALVVLTCVVILDEWGLAGWASSGAAVAVLVVVALLAIKAHGSRAAFLIVALVLTAALALRVPDWLAIVQRGLGTAAFIAGFFTALSSLRSVAQTSPAIRATGRYLASQPPGRRYIALSSGGTMFALLLNYGAIALLGTLASASAKSEPDLEIRRIRTRRMLLAIQRGFVSTLPWSPMSFAVAISTAVIPGTAWSELVVPGLISSALLTTAGWALDRMFKPRRSGAPAEFKPEGTWRQLLPLGLLLVILVGLVSVLHFVTDIRVVGVVMPVVPAIALGWIILQTRSLRGTLSHIRHYVTEELPAYRLELVLLMMAGYIGTVGAALLLPLVTASGFDASGLPGWLVLAVLVWIVPIAGQIGMNPILCVTLLAPLIPSADQLGVNPTAIVVALTSGWALSGITSPFTATTLLIGSFAGVSAFEVGTRWNGIYFLVSAVLMTAWAIVFGLWTA
ncbi:hypothetical protein ACFO5X_02800 [Seohaeicola nanhaiensis]|uniref:H+/citrate symporter n=1 Tax=Seohaeicola nanhaiensis TaxID=1387282 RepID=A0ABV9KBY4_9RHOB